MIKKLLGCNPLYYYEMVRIMRNRIFMYIFFLSAIFHTAIFLNISGIQSIIDKHTYGNQFFPGYAFFPIINLACAFLLLGSFALSFLHENNHNNDELTALSGLNPRQIVNGRFFAFVSLLIMSCFLSLPFCMMSFYCNHLSLHPNCFLLPLSGLITIPVYQVMALFAAIPNKYIRNAFTLFWLPIAAVLIAVPGFAYTSNISIFEIDIAFFSQPVHLLGAFALIVGLHLSNQVLIARHDPIPGIVFRLFIFLLYPVTTFLLATQVWGNTVTFLLLTFIYVSSYQLNSPAYLQESVYPENSKFYSRIISLQKKHHTYNFCLYLFLITLSFIPYFTNGTAFYRTGYYRIILLIPFLMFVFQMGFHRMKHLQQRPMAYKAAIVFSISGCGIFANMIFTNPQALMYYSSRTTRKLYLILYLLCIIVGMYKMYKSVHQNREKITR